MKNDLFSIGNYKFLLFSALIDVDKTYYCDLIEFIKFVDT